MWKFHPNYCLMQLLKEQDLRHQGHFTLVLEASFESGLYHRNQKQQQQNMRKFPYPCRTTAIVSYEELGLRDVESCSTQPATYLCVLLLLEIRYLLEVAPNPGELGRLASAKGRSTLVPDCFTSGPICPHTHAPSTFQGQPIVVLNAVPQTQPENPGDSTLRTAPSNDDIKRRCHLTASAAILAKKPR